MTRTGSSVSSSKSTQCQASVGAPGPVLQKYWVNNDSSLPITETVIMIRCCKRNRPVSSKDTQNKFQRTFNTLSGFLLRIFYNDFGFMSSMVPYWNMMEMTCQTQANNSQINVITSTIKCVFCRGITSYKGTSFSCQKDCISKSYICQFLPDIYNITYCQDKKQSQKDSNNNGNE